jgi:hypothetical protein
LYERLQQAAAVDDRCNQNPLILDPIDDAVAVDKTLADCRIADLGTIRPISGNSRIVSAVSTILDATALAYQTESRSMYDAIDSMSSMASGDQTRPRAIC